MLKGKFVPMFTVMMREAAGLERTTARGVFGRFLIVQ
jgi:hypothetical protein